MPRKSKFDYIELANDDPMAGKPSAPAELSSDEVIEWNNLVGAMPIGFYSKEMLPMLIGVCKSIRRSRLVNAKLATFTEEMLDDEKHFNHYSQLMHMAQQEDRFILNASTKLKLTPSSRHARRLDTRIKKQQIAPSADVVSAI